MNGSTERIFLEYSAGKLDQLTERIENCIARLDDRQIWARGAETENAIGNLALHLCGNVRQWIVSGVGGQPDTRRRDEEFAARGGIEARELIERLRSTVGQAAAVLRGLESERLRERVEIQGYQVTVLEAIYHVVEHFSGHTGQIIFATKMLTGEDLAYYRHLQAGAAAHSERVP